MRLRTCARSCLADRSRNDPKLCMDTETKVHQVSHKTNLGRGGVVEDRSIGEQGVRLGQKTGRIPACRKIILVVRKHRPRRPLSKGIRIYFHHTDGVRTRTSYNERTGRDIAGFYAYLYPIKAIGNESGAMTIHIAYPYSHAWLAEHSL